jgi:hypothetical protein
VDEEEEEEAQDESIPVVRGYAFTLSGGSDVNDDRVNVMVGGVSVNFLIDSGASHNVLDKSTWEYMKKCQVKGTCILDTRPLYPYGAEKPLVPLGKFNTEIKLGHKLLQEDFYVLNCTGTPLLSKDTARNLGVLLLGYPLHTVSDKPTTDDTATTIHTATLNTTTITNDTSINKCTANTAMSADNFRLQIREKFPKVFEGVGKLKDYEVQLEIDTAVKPVIQPARRYALHLQDEIKLALEEKIKNGIVEKVDRPSPWVSPMIVGKKKNDSLRLIVDAREANKAIRRELYPIPTIEDTTRKLQGAKYFSVLDCNEAFHQLMLHEKSREITTFSSPLGLMRYKTLMFGLNCASEIFQKVIEQITSKCPGGRFYNSITNDF